MLDLTNTQPAIDKLKRIEGELNIEMIERTDAIRAILIALITGQHGVFLGPPGTGKSWLILKLAKRIATNGQNGSGLKTFVRLITKTTQPEELFGPISIATRNQQHAAGSRACISGRGFQRILRHPEHTAHHHE